MEPKRPRRRRALLFFALFFAALVVFEIGHRAISEEKETRYGTELLENFETQVNAEGETYQKLLRQLLAVLPEKNGDRITLKDGSLYTQSGYLELLFTDLKAEIIDMMTAFGVESMYFAQIYGGYVNLEYEPGISYLHFVFYGQIQDHIDHKVIHSSYCSSHKYGFAVEVLYWPGI